jgi:cation diffusion facilitator family transporter
MSAFNEVKRFPQARRVTWIGLIINLFLISFKALGGIWGRSEALIADAVHSASDFITDVLVLIGLTVSERPMDETHPYGHGRVETIATFLVGLVLGLVGLGIGLKAIATMIKGVSYTPRSIALIAALVSIIVKEGLYRYTIRVGQQTNSQALRANAWHHRSDALSSVATFLGVGGAMLNPRWLILDPLVACGVAVFIVKVSAEITWTAFSDLVDTSVQREIRDQIERVAKGVSGVLNLHGLKTRHVGNNIFVDVHIEVSPRISVTEGHHIATQLKRAILGQVDNMAEVNVHVEPEGDSQRQPGMINSEAEIEARVYQIVNSIEGIKGLHGLKIRHHGADVSLEVDIEVDPQIRVVEGHALAKAARQQILGIERVKEVMVHVDIYRG